MKYLFIIPMVIHSFLVLGQNEVIYEGVEMHLDDTLGFISFENNDTNHTTFLTNGIIINPSIDSMVYTNLGHDIYAITKLGGVLYHINIDTASEKYKKDMFTIYSNRKLTNVEICKNEKITEIYVSKESINLYVENNYNDIFYIIMIMFDDIIKKENK